MLPKLRPMRLAQRPQPFDHPDWIFEIKYDGFRALAYIENGESDLVSRKSHTYKSFRELREELTTCINVENAIIDGEIVCLGEDGRPQFYELLYRRREPFFCAFDLLWLNGEDLRALPLYERKKRLRKLIPRSKKSRLLFSDHIEQNGRDVFQAACGMDLEGIVAKLKHAPYMADGRRSTWIKIKNPRYTQAEGRHELFEEMRN
jgi:bifunctional non-homologous end joining protein LigD